MVVPGGQRRQADTRRRLTAMLPLLLGLTFGLAACGPEAERTQGGGPGADPGNRDEEVQLHGDEAPEQRIYFDTPIKRPAEAG